MGDALIGGVNINQKSGGQRQPRVKVERSRAQQERERRQQAQERRQQDEERRQKAIVALTPHHIAALRAVSTSQGLEQIEAFTFDVLGGLGLLRRPKGSKAKTDWRLTNEGQTALEKHSHASADREVGRNPPRLVVGEQLGTANGGV